MAEACPLRRLSRANRAPVAEHFNIQSAGPRGPAPLQDVGLLEKLAHFNREVIPERRMHAKGSGAYETFTVTAHITCVTRARLFQVGKQMPVLGRFSTVAGASAQIKRPLAG